jgi:DNA-binding GntR family transcriptional regulator
LHIVIVMFRHQSSKNPLTMDCMLYTVAAVSRQRLVSPGNLAHETAALAPRRPVLASLVTHRTLEESAYADLRRAIADGRLAPGEKIVANTIATEAGVSRIPVMQALRRLESEGFVRITPHKDVVVTRLSQAEVRERFLLMSALETLCLRESAARITPELLARLRALQKDIKTGRAKGDAVKAVAADGEFHRLLWHASDLKQVTQILQNLWDAGEYYRLQMHTKRGGFAKESLAEHEKILLALAAGDIERAAKAIERHRLGTMERWRDFVTATP